MGNLPETENHQPSRHVYHQTHLWCQKKLWGKLLKTEIATQTSCRFVTWDGTFFPLKCSPFVFVRIKFDSPYRFFKSKFETSPGKLESSPSPPRPTSWSLRVLWPPRHLKRNARKGDEFHPFFSQVGLRVSTIFCRLRALSSNRRLCHFFIVAKSPTSRVPICF